MIKILPHELLRFFDSKVNPITYATSEAIVKLIDLDDYKSINSKYGKEYCLIILQMMESLEDYGTCAEILKQLNEI